MRGQYADLAFEHRDNISLDECVAMAEDKTSALLGSACELGALAGGARHTRAGQLRAFGEHLGLAFQLIDDVLGIWGDPQVTGKPVMSDLRTRKKTLPVVAVLSADTPGSRELATMYRTRGALTDVELERAAHLIEQAGGRAWAEAEADRHVDTALACLAAADPTKDAGRQLTALSGFITRRDH
ncbi:MAG: polyprenyl synthetase family protein [Pseudonocardiaceae bacterium]